MKTKIQSVGPLLASIFLCAGCVGTGPNTQQGAVAGGALGAIAGAIIGNNSGGNGLNGALIGGAAGAIAGGTLGNQADHQRGTIYGSESAATTQEVVDSPPPPPPPQREVVYERTQPDAVWVEGFWLYRGRGSYAWVPGHWEVPPPQYHRYVAAHWQRRGRGYVYINGYWH